MAGKKFSKFDKETIINVLKHHSGYMMSARDIVEFLYKENPEVFEDIRERRKKKFTHTNDFLMQLTAELHSKMGDVHAHKVGSRKYYSIVEGRSISSPSQSKNNQTSRRKKTNDQKEHKLYPIVCEYLWNSHRVFSMRVDEKRASGGRGSVQNSHLFPDIVGMEEDPSLTRNWNGDVIAMSNMTLGKNVGIWSVEVKVEVDSKNVRKCLNQTVSNSIWANRAYLAAAKFSTAKDGMPDEDVQNELNEFAKEHGIGVIKIDDSDYRKSAVIIEAKELDINWNGANKLAEKNKDFMKFLKICRRYHESNTGDREWQDMIIFLSNFLISDED